MSRMRALSLGLMLSLTGAGAQASPRLAIVSSPQDGVFSLSSVDPATGAVQPVVGEVKGLGIAWSPNGTHMAYVHEEGPKRYAVSVVEIATGKTVKVSGDLNVGQFLWGPDSTTLAVIEVRDEGRAAAIYAGGISGQAPRLVSGNHVVAIPPDVAVSPTGRYFCFRAMAADGSRPLIIADTANGSCTQLAPGMVVGAHEWSPTADVLGIHARSPENEVRRVYVVKAPEFQLTPVGEPGQEMTGFQWSPSGQHLAYRIQVGEKLAFYGLYEMATGRQGLIDGAQGGVSLDWSPDGSAYAAVDAGETGGTTLADLKVGSVASPVFADSWLAPKSTGVTAVIWRPDGRTVAFIKRDILLETDCVTRETRVLFDIHSVRAALWAPDGSKIAAIARRLDAEGHAGRLYQVWLVNPDEASGRCVTEGFHTGVVDWSPDSQHLLLFIPTGPGTLGLAYVVRADGKLYEGGTPYLKVGERVHALTWYPR